MLISITCLFSRPSFGKQGSWWKLKIAWGIDIQILVNASAILECSYPQDRGGGANQSEVRLVRPFLFHETKRGEPVGICLFLMSGRTSRKFVCFWKSGRTSRKFVHFSMSGRTSRKNSRTWEAEARWMRKESSAPSGDHLKEMREKDEKGWAWNTRSLWNLSCASPQKNGHQNTLF